MLLPELYQPLKIGPMTIANRLMQAAMGAGKKFEENGDVSDRMIAYFAERLKGEPGMMALGASNVVPPESPASMRSGLFSDESARPLTRFIEAMRPYNTRLGAQLFDGGGTEGSGPGTLISPSGLQSNVRSVRGDPSSRRKGQPNRALDLDEIPQIVQYFADAAVRAMNCGFDFVEIHAGHGYLISNFLTPLFNRRTDRYGGSFENRTRFLLEILDAVKRAVGKYLAVGLKFNGDDFIGEDGWTLEDSCRLAPIAEAAGADYITVTAGVIGSPKLTIPPMYEPQGCYVSHAAAVKAVVGIPVGTVGRIKNPIMARDIIVQGQADFVCMGRPTIADGEIFEKIRRGALDDIRPCLAECRGCIDERMRNHGQTSCVVNPRIERELDTVEIEGSAREAPKRVLVVGGGLAGLEAARRTGFSGHQVILCEANGQLGGQNVLASRIAGRKEIGDILPWYVRQIGKYGVEVRLNTRVDEATVRQIAPDVVIVATGSVPQVPSDMIDLVLNAGGIDMLMLDDVMEPNAVLGRNVLVIGGDQNGMVVTDHLAQCGCTVTLVEAHNHFGAKLAAHDRWYVTNRQNANGVRRIKNVHAVEADDDDNIWIVTQDGREMLPGIETVVFAGERRSDRGVAEITEKMNIETHLVGDANDAVSENASTILATIQQSFDLARHI